MNNTEEKTEKIRLRTGTNQIITGYTIIRSTLKETNALILKKELGEILWKIINVADKKIRNQAGWIRGEIKISSATTRFTII